MIGWRARLGFLVPPGNPTVEPEAIAMAPEGVSVHFTRMVARGVAGSREGGAERNRMMLDHIDLCVEMLAQAKPDAIVLAHTATSYQIGRDGEAQLIARLEDLAGTRVVTAFAAVVAALRRLGVKRVAVGTPYSEAQTLAGKAHLEAHGLAVVRFDNLKDVGNIYDATAEHAYRLARAVDTPQAEAVFLSGTGMPTVAVLDMLERDLGKPVLSSNAAMLWHGLRIAGVREAIAGYGRLLTLA